MSPVEIIAEVGVNHNGCLSTAKEYIKACAKSGADIVKFQYFEADSLATEQAELASYQSNNLGGKYRTQKEMLKQYELNLEEMIELMRYCEECDVEFLCTSFDINGLRYLLDNGMRRVKIPSGEITNLPLLRFIADRGVPVILSTGMCYMDEVRNAIDVLFEGLLDPARLTVLHCTSNYPARVQSINLLAMSSIHKEFGVNVGYSDHSDGTEVALIAAALGATIIEKHVTFDRLAPGPDHLASLPVDEFESFVAKVRSVNTILGSGTKEPHPDEMNVRKVARKSVVARRHIKAGEMISASDLDCKRPGDGLSPMQWDRIVGSCAVTDFKPDDKIII